MRKKLAAGRLRFFSDGLRRLPACKKNWFEAAGA